MEDGSQLSRDICRERGYTFYRETALAGHCCRRESGVARLSSPFAREPGKLLHRGHCWISHGFSAVHGLVLSYDWCNMVHLSMLFLTPMSSDAGAPLERERESHLISTFTSCKIFSKSGYIAFAFTKRQSSCFFSIMLHPDLDLAMHFKHTLTHSRLHHDAHATGLGDHAAHHALQWYP